MSETMDVLVLSPHTDDSELGAGGTIHKLQREGHDVHYVAFSSCDASLTEAEQGQLRAEFESVMELVDPEEYYLFDYVVRRFTERRQEILEDLIRVREEVDPDLVVGPSLGDAHQDHAVVAREMHRAFKSGPSIISYEQPWNHVSFETQLFASLQPEDVEWKVRQLREYDSQLDRGRPYFAESFIRGLATVRGLQSDTEYAEAFEVVRWVL
jgi:LmbE family N-acetylglucosaminyl deacetylase